MSDPFSTSSKKIVTKSAKKNDPKPQNEESQAINQQKPEANGSSNKNHKISFSDRVYKHPYMRKFIEEVKNPEPVQEGKSRKASKKPVEEVPLIKDSELKCKCIYCDEILYINSLTSHIPTPKHKRNTPEEEQDKELQELIKFLASRVNHNDENREEETKDYLEFLAFLMSEKLPYEQISRLGKFLQNLYQENRLSFLDGFMFDSEEVSKIARDSFGRCLLAELKNDLRATPYSFCLDSSTIGGDNIVAIKVRYVDDSDRKEPIKNRILGISTLQESSSGETLFNIVKEKLFSDDILQRNFISIAHDYASSISSYSKGLVGRLQKLKTSFLDLKDPCHALSLTIKNSMKFLPSQILDFISSIHKHFKNSPQRRVAFQKFQMNKGLDPLLLVPYIRTRWLSLGDSLKRLITLWDVLTFYIRGLKETIIPEENTIDDDEDNEEDLNTSKKLSYTELHECLTNNYFKAQILFLYYIIKKLNTYNIRLQDQTLTAPGLKSEVFACYDEMCSLIMDPLDITQSNFSKRANLQWDKAETHRRWFLDNEAFINKNAKSANLYEMMKFDAKEKEEFAADYKSFIAKILYYLLNYLPLNDKLLHTLDFLEFTESTDMSLIDKIKYFNDYFDLIDKEHTEEFESELTKLAQKANTYLMMKARDTEKKITFEDLWSMIRNNDNLKHIAYLARAAKALPVSSAPIEQSFSIMGLLKTDQRNQLSEESLEALLLIHDCFSKKPIKITAEMINEFRKVRSELNGRKNRTRTIKKLKRKESLAQAIAQEGLNILGSDKKVKISVKGNESELASSYQEIVDSKDQGDSLEKKDNK